MRRFLLLAPILLSLSAPSAGRAAVPVDVFAAYLHVDPADATNPAVAIPLATLGIAPGDSVLLQCVGDWDAGPGGDDQTNLLAVFSSSSTLLATTAPHRVPGALATVLYNFSGGTWPGNEPTDIIEDFVVNDIGTLVKVPASATHLFVTPADIYYRDNADPDGDLAVTGTVIVEATAAIGGPLPSALALAAHPNPVMAATSIAFQLTSAADVRLAIHDLAGRHVRTVFAGRLPAGNYRERWDGDDDAGRRVAAGSYFARLDGAGRTLARRLVVLR